jgi:uncharacterized membrane protein
MFVTAYKIELYVMRISYGLESLPVSVTCFIFICGLLNDAVSISLCSLQWQGAVINNLFERMWKRTFVA